jgi:hypothetical protein
MHPFLDQSTRLVRGAAGLGVSTAQQALGLAQRLRDRGRPARPKAGMDDTTLKAKVESTVFRGAAAAKEKVSVTVVDGIVELRGEVKRPEEVADLETRARAVPEVRGVQNLLHLPKTPARTASKPRGTAANRPRTGRQRTTAESPRAVKPAVAGDQAEDTPVEKAAKREGRSAAPMGSTNDTAS